MRTVKTYSVYANILIVSGIIILIVSTLLFAFKTTAIDFSASLRTDIFSHYGSLVGGLVGSLFSLAGVFLLILNLKGQERDFVKQQIENRFFELLKIHRENSYELVIQKKRGREVFKWLQKELYKCIEVVIKVNKELETNLDQKKLINAAYISFFFGAVGKYSSGVVRKYLCDYDTNFVDKMLEEFKVSKRIISETEYFPYKLFDGHQSRLGHYYRHLYQTVKYINNHPSEILDYQDKYQYIKTLRAQLITQEQVLLFFNSLSSLGINWEQEKTLDVNNRLITKYNLIKNIPKGYVSYISPEKYYPDVRYEGQYNDTENKLKLIKEYC